MNNMGVCAMETPNVFVGNYENVIGQNVCVKVRDKFVNGKVRSYYFKSRKFCVACEDGKIRRVCKIYV